MLLHSFRGVLGPEPGSEHRLFMSHDLLDSGTHLGQYEVVRPLGAGGMGQVWLARDSNLDREVAIKLLPDHLQSDQQALMRFEREAKLLAAINHPNIAQIYGSEESDGKRFLVLELVEGQTLSERLKQGPMPIDETLNVCKQIAVGLETAHEKGIVHRDLKPGNVMLRHDETVKVLDFGLACATDVPDTRASADSPTIAHRHHPEGSNTIPGMIMGTAGYMSPEQARGRTVDKRSDIWSFGVILHECLAGQKLFGGESVPDSLGAILHKEVDWSALPARIPAGLKRLLRHCVVREPKKRVHDIADARIEREEIEEQLRDGPIESAEPVPPTTGRGLLWPVACVLLAVALVASLLWPLVLPGRPADVAPRRTVVGMEQITDLPGVQFHPSVSPDGKQVLYVTDDGGDEDIFLQRIGGANPVNLTEDSEVGDSDPAFSPDGNQIAFRSEREGGGIFIMGATGESPRRISDVGFDPAWSPDGKQIVYTTQQVRDAYSRTYLTELWVVDIASRQKNQLHAGDAVGPQWSPD
ncbi:MAG: protein kinase domain-containing protein, partial [Pirellulaceae bacterium]